MWDELWGKEILFSLQCRTNYPNFLPSGFSIAHHQGEDLLLYQSTVSLLCPSMLSYLQNHLNQSLSHPKLYKASTYVRKSCVESLRVRKSSRPWSSEPKKGLELAISVHHGQQWYCIIINHFSHITIVKNELGIFCSASLCLFPVAFVVV